jgi:ubiquinone/menaquinone biosynthesis C-methylase UbiE
MSGEPGLRFDRIAAEYDRVRPSYPDELVDRACSIAGLSGGSRVAEVGCGTGKLTVALVERRLRVDAVDPGENMLRVARERVGAAPVRFHLGRFEDVELPGGYEALFSATAFHWVDPEVGWAKAARLLRPGGVLALFSHVAGSPLPVDDALRAAWRETAPDARALSGRREDELWAGAEARRDNVSALWRWLERRDDFDPAAAELFEDVRIDSVRVELDESADELIALTRTQSAYIKLDAERRRLLEERIAAAVADAGGRYRSALFALLVTARRRNQDSKLSS